VAPCRDPFGQWSRQRSRHGAPTRHTRVRRRGRWEAIPVRRDREPRVRGADKRLRFSDDADTIRHWIRTYFCARALRPQSTNVLLGWLGRLARPCRPRCPYDDRVHDEPHGAGCGRRRARHGRDQGSVQGLASARARPDNRSVDHVSSMSTVETQVPDLHALSAQVRKCASALENRYCQLNCHSAIIKR